MATLIQNTSIEPLSLPYPFSGILAGLQSVVVSATPATVLAALGGVTVPAGVKITDLTTGYTGPVQDSTYAQNLIEQSTIGGVGLIGNVYSIEADFTALVTGTPDDITIATNLPFKSRIQSVALGITTASATTGTLRDAAAGGGNALSNAISVSSAGIISWNLTTTRPTLAAGSALYLRRADRAFAGNISIILTRVP